MPSDLNNLYSQTQLQVSFGINMVALHHGQPKIMNLKDIIAAFVRHRREVVTRRTIFELRKARDRAHILEALAIALANIDPIIELIRRAPTPAEAKAALVARSWELPAAARYRRSAGSWALPSRPATGCSNTPRPSAPTLTFPSARRRQPSMRVRP